MFVYRTNGTKFQPGHTQVTKHSGRKTVSVWAWFSGNGGGAIHRINGRLNSEQYIDILENCLLPTAWERYEPGQIPFVQDRSPIHTAHVVKDWFVDHPEFDLIPWPSKAADFNPIENLWAEMVRDLDAIHVTNSNELWSIVSGIWDRLKERESYLRTLTNSMVRF